MRTPSFPAASVQRVAALVVAGVLGVVFAACSVSGQAAHVRTPEVHVTERDFQISAPAELANGAVTLAVHNSGPEAHELIVVRSIDGQALPIRPDGLTVDEDAVDSRTVGALEPGAAGSDRLLRLQLKPGRYDLFCNMSGHLLGGMHAELRVT